MSVTKPLSTSTQDSSPDPLVKANGRRAHVWRVAISSPGSGGNVSGEIAMRASSRGKRSLPLARSTTLPLRISRSLGVACRIEARSEHVGAQRLAGLPGASPPMPAAREAQCRAIGRIVGVASDERTARSARRKPMPRLARSPPRPGLLGDAGLQMMRLARRA